MLRILCILIFLSALPGLAAAADTATSGNAGRSHAQSRPVKEAEHTKTFSGTARWRSARSSGQMQESGGTRTTQPDLPACKIAYGDYCGMKHAD
jgi:hypothetical protein